MALAYTPMLWLPGPAAAPTKLPAGAAAQRQKLGLQQTSQRAASVQARGIGSDAAQGWIDISKLVSGGGKQKTAYDKLASKIGRDVHVDVNGWHLFLRDITATQGFKMDQALANAIGPEVEGGKYPDADLEALLKKVPLELGKGKTTVSLFDAIPSTSFRNFSNAIKDYAKDL